MWQLCLCADRHFKNAISFPGAAAASTENTANSDPSALLAVEEQIENFLEDLQVYADEEMVRIDIELAEYMSSLSSLSLNTDTELGLNHYLQVAATAHVLRTLYNMLQITIVTLDGRYRLYMMGRAKIDPPPVRLHEEEQAVKIFIAEVMEDLYKCRLSVSTLAPILENNRNVEEYKELSETLSRLAEKSERHFRSLQGYIDEQSLIAELSELSESSKHSQIFCTLKD